MSAIYQSVGAVVFWCAATLLTFLAVGTGALLWRDRARIRWSWVRHD